MLFLVLFAALFAPFWAQSLPEWTPDKEDAIRDFLTATSECRHVPGVSFALVYDGVVRMTEAYGLDDLEQDVPATVDSRYCIGSLTKAFTSTLIGILIDESDGQYTWDSPIKEIMGEDFWLSEPLPSERGTLRDLLAHKMGLATYGGIWIMGLPQGPTRQEYCDRLRFLPGHPSSDFRQSLIYSNFMYMLTSCVAERLAGGQQTFEQLVQEKIFDRLGMNHTVFLESVGETTPIPAQYIWNYQDQELDRLDEKLVTEAVPPAEASGGICSSAADMSRWLLMQLGHDLEDVISESSWRETHTSQVQSTGGRTHKRPQFPHSFENLAHGMGFFVGDYRGYRMISHDGTVGGFSSLLTLFPDLDLGIFTNVNGPMAPHSDNFLHALHMYAVDITMEEIPWLDVTSGNNVTQGTACTYPLPWSGDPPVPLHTSDTIETANQQPVRSRKVAKTQSLPEEDYEAYLGTYGHHLLGDMNIYYNSTADEMWGTAGQIGIVRLIPTADSHIFDFEFEGALWYLSDLGPPMPPIVFQDLQDGVYHEVVVEAIDSQIPPVYVRGLAWEDVPPPPEYPECD